MQNASVKQNSVQFFVDKVFLLFVMPDPKKDYKRCAQWIHNLGNLKLDIKTFVSHLINLNNESTSCFSSLYYKLKNVKENCINSVKYLPHGKRIWSSSSKSFVSHK
jgi:hypothetical protein